MSGPVFREPYFLPANHSEFLANGESWEENNQQFRQAQKYWFYRCALDYLVHSDLRGSYFEFGIHRGRTFTMAMSLDAFYASNKGQTQGGLVPLEGGGYFTEYVAFDSFDGFPDGTSVTEHPYYTAGYARTREDDFLHLIKSYGQSTQRVRLVRGFYSASLNEELAADFRSRDTRVSLVCLDCNLYESYRDVLAWCDEFLQPGAIVYLDDFNTFLAQDDRGPRRAWGEHRQVSRWSFDEFLNVGWCGRSFVVQRRT